MLGDGVELAIVGFGIDTPETGSSDVRQTRAEPVAQQAEQPEDDIATRGSGETLEVFRVAVNSNPSDRIATKAVESGSPFCIVDHEKVEAAIAIIVESSGGHGPFRRLLKNGGNGKSAVGVRAATATLGPKWSR